MLTHPNAKCRNESHPPQILAALRKTARLICFTAILGAFSSTPATSGAEIDARTAQWDADQNKSQRADARTGGPGLTHDLAYDGRSRVTAITPSAGSPASYTYDEAGNRTNAGYALEGVDASLNNYTATPMDTRGYDLAGNLASFNARDTYYGYDGNHRLVSVIDAAIGVEDDFSVSIPPVYTTQSGIWAATGAVLSETTGAPGRQKVRVSRSRRATAHVLELAS